jgi:hypothetical protein
MGPKINFSRQVWLAALLLAALWPVPLAVSQWAGTQLCATSSTSSVTLGNGTTTTYFYQVGQATSGADAEAKALEKLKKQIAEAAFPSISCVGCPLGDVGCEKSVIASQGTITVVGTAQEVWSNGVLQGWIVDVAYRSLTVVHMTCSECGPVVP